MINSNFVLKIITLLILIILSSYLIYKISNKEHFFDAISDMKKQYHPTPDQYATCSAFLQDMIQKKYWAFDTNGAGSMSPCSGFPPIAFTAAFQVKINNSGWVKRSGKADAYTYITSQIQPLVVPNVPTPPSPPPAPPVPVFNQLYGDWYFTDTTNNQRFITINSTNISVIKNGVSQTYNVKTNINDNDINTDVGSSDLQNSYHIYLPAQPAQQTVDYYSSSGNLTTAQLFPKSQLNSNIQLSGAVLQMASVTPYNPSKSSNTINKMPINPVVINNNQGAQNDNTASTRQCSIYFVKNKKIDICNGTDPEFNGIPLFSLHERTLRDMISSNKYTSTQVDKINSVLNALDRNNGYCKLPIYNWSEQVNSVNGGSQTPTNYKTAYNNYAALGPLDSWAYCFKNDPDGKHTDGTNLQQYSNSAIVSKQDTNPQNTIEKIGISTFNFDMYSSYICNKPIEDLTQTRTNVFNNPVPSLPQNINILGITIDGSNIITDIHLYIYNSLDGTLKPTVDSDSKLQDYLLKNNPFFTINGLIADQNGIDPNDGIPAPSPSINTNSINLPSLQNPGKRLAIVSNLNNMKNYLFSFDNLCSIPYKTKFVDENNNYLSNSVQLQLTGNIIVNDLPPSSSYPYYGSIMDINNTINYINNQLAAIDAQIASNTSNLNPLISSMSNGVDKYTLSQSQYASFLQSQDKDQFLLNQSASFKKISRPAFNGCATNGTGSSSPGTASPGTASPGTASLFDSCTGNNYNIYIGFLNIPSAKNYTFNVGSISNGILLFGIDTYDINDLLNAYSSGATSKYIVGYDSSKVTSSISLEAKKYLFVFIHNSSIGATIFASPAFPITDSSISCDENGPSNSIYQDIPASYFYTAESSYQDYSKINNDLNNQATLLKSRLNDLNDYITNNTNKIVPSTLINSIKNILIGSQFVTNTYPPVYISKVYTTNDNNTSSDVVFLSL